MIALLISVPFNSTFEARLRRSTHVEIFRGHRVYNKLTIHEGYTLIIPQDEASKDEVDRLHGIDGNWIDV